MFLEQTELARAGSKYLHVLSLDSMTSSSSSSYALGGIGRIFCPAKRQRHGSCQASAWKARGNKQAGPGANRVSLHPASVHTLGPTGVWWKVALHAKPDREEQSLGCPRSFRPQTFSL